VNTSSQEITGRVKRIIFAKDDFAIVAFTGEDRSEFSGKGTHRGVIHPGADVRLVGRWTEYNGRPQFVWDSCSEHIPRNPEAVAAYMTKLDGFGPVTAMKAVQLYGAESVLDVLRERPEEIAAAIKGLTPEKALAASEKLKASQANESVRIELIELFDGIGFIRSTVDRCVDIFGTDAARVIRENPFQLIIKRIPSAGFKRVDTLWMKLRLDPESEVRQGYCLWYVLNQTSSVWMHSSECINRMGAEISGANPDLKRAFEYANSAKLVDKLRTKGGTFFSLVKLNNAENNAARMIARRLAIAALQH